MEFILAEDLELMQKGKLEWIYVTDLVVANYLCNKYNYRITQKVQDENIILFRLEPDTSFDEIVNKYYE